MNEEQNKLKSKDWRDLGFDPHLEKPSEETQKGEFISGESFDAKLDDLAFNRVIQFRNLPTQPLGGDSGKTYWDKANKKLKMWVDATGKWVDINYTSTSTSTTSSSSSSSSSTSSTSSSTSSTSSSSSTSTT